MNLMEVYASYYTVFSKAEGDTNLAEWLKRKENVYTSPDIQNEVIKLMGLQILLDIASNLQCSPFLTVMADELQISQIKSKSHYF